MAVGQVTEPEIQSMWTNAVDILEKHRVYADATARDEGELDVLVKSLEGTYAPGVSNAAADFRALISSPLNPGVIRGFFVPLLLEYMKFISEDGTVTLASATDVPTMMQALYDHMINNNLTIESRLIGHDITATKTTTREGVIVGTGDIQRLFVDYRGYEIENCTIERKNFRCIQDQNTGSKEHAELFTVQGEAPPPDQLGRNAADVLGHLGTGNQGRIRALHAGTSDGGSRLRNSSFSTYDVAATDDFDGWAFTGTTVPTQDTSDFYRSHPNASTDGSMLFSANAKMTQTLAKMRFSGSGFDPSVPYFCRIMWKRLSSADGTLTLRLGSSSEAITLAGTNWTELFIGNTTAKDQWPRNFNEDGFTVEIELSGNTTGTLLVDDAVLSPYTLIDGTWWAIKQSATVPLPFLFDDVLHVTDTGGAPATGELQYWLHRAGMGYLPAAVTDTWPDPA